MQLRQTDQHFMRRALRLAALGRHASPNPMVGCVLVGGAGEIVGEGFHPQAGQPHAEVFALRDAGDKARGATAYVTLEPCAHHGRTPPCAEALLAAGVGRVVAAMVDPDQRVGGQGLEKLRQGGAEIDVGVLEAEARALNAAYLKQRTTGVPWFVLKTAMTLDGKIATRTGDSQWITSVLSRTAVHRQLRDRCDAVLTGVGTVLADDPSLDTRLIHRLGRNPWRIVVDSHLRTPLTAKIIRMAQEDGRTIMVTTSAPDPAKRAEYEAVGCRVLVCNSFEGRVNLSDLAVKLGTRRDIMSVLVECGGTLAAGLISAGLIDRWLQYIAPKIVGGSEAPGPIGSLGITHMAQARPVLFQRVRRSGPDIVFDVRFG